MAFVEWYKTYELGIYEFDEHHRHLICLLNSVYEKLTCGAELDELEAVLGELTSYAAYHFAAEEHWMEVHRFPDTSSHKEEHKKFISRIKGFQQDFHAGKVNLPVELVQFLFNWLTHHILKTDAQFKDHI